MKTFDAKFPLAVAVAVALAFSGCASGGSQFKAEKISQPSTPVPEKDKGLFSNALKAQNTGQYEAAIKMWNDFLAQNPNSYAGHNNLGLVYENQDMISQALQEFEKAYRLQPTDPKIRQNLVRAMRFKANLYHENREYFKTLEILTRLEQIVPPEEKQGILFKQEQVEDQIFLQVLKTDDMAAYEDFVLRFPDGLNAVRAREYMEKHANQISKATSQKKKRKYRQSGMIQSVESGNLSAGTSSQAPPEYGTPSYYGTSQPSATYTPPSASPAQVAGSRKKKFDIFGLDPSATESISEDTMTAQQGAVAESRIAIPFEDFEKPERISGETAKDPKPSSSEDPTGRSQPEVLADAPDSRPDLEFTQPVAAELETPDIQMEQTTQEAGPLASAEPVELVQETSVAATAPEEGADSPEAVVPVENTEPATAMAEASKAEPETPAEPVEAVAQAPAEPEILDTAPDAEASPEPEVEVAAIEQAIKEAEAELIQAESGEDIGAPVEETATAPVPSATQVLDKELISQTVASLVPSPQPEAAMAKDEQMSATQASPANTVVVIQVGQGSTLNVRVEPSASGEILGYLENGDMMPYVKESGGWYQIKIDEGLFGWVSSKFATTRTLTSDAPLVFDGEAETRAGATEVPAPAADDSQTATPMVEITVGEDSTLNVRSMPSSEGAVVDALAEGDTLPLIKESGDWYQLQFEDGSTGWVSKKFSKILNAGAEAETMFPEVETDGPVTAEAPPAQNPNIPVTTVVVITVKEGSSLRVRSAPSSQGEVLGSLKSGDMRPLLEESGDWYQVEFQDGQSGWVSQKFSSKMDMGSNVIPQP